jgi:hypothetical protein
MESKPHLVLNWTFDIPNKKLFIKIADGLEYEALEGGRAGFKKTYRGVVTHIDMLVWQEEEKFWISEHYGDIYGYFQPDENRTKPHPEFGWDQVCFNGLGPDGEYLDHMQRMQIVLEGHDMATVWIDSSTNIFLTPDNGKTIYKRIATRDVNYPPHIMANTSFWPEWSQACLMQPRTSGYQLSTHKELKKAGAPRDIIKKCLTGSWPSPKHPELQKWYVNPTNN